MTEEIHITPNEYNEILNIQQEILNMIAEQKTTKNILEQLCKLAESLLPNSVASIMLLDNKTHLLNVKSAPSVPTVGHKALANLKPGPKGGSCGNAVYKNEPQYVQNTFEDERWEDLRELAVNFNLCSCWSMPIKSKNKKAIGSFALSSFEHRAPNMFHKKLLESCASIVSIVLKNQLNEEKLELNTEAIQNASDGIVITDKNNKIIEINKAMKNLYGYNFDELEGKDPKYLASNIHPKSFYKQMWKSLIKFAHWSGEVTNKKKDGSFITQWVSISVIYDEDGKVKNHLAVFTDLTKIIEAEKKLEYLAFHDTLTHAYNKSYFEKIVEEDNDSKALILLNIDNFSYINTAYGFEIGDLLLKKLSLILKDEFNAKNLFRINSDEFALLFDNEINLKEKILEIQNYFFENSVDIDVDDIKVNFTFSYGAAKAKENLLRKASAAVKNAKEMGKNKFYIFEEDEISDYKKRESFIQTTHLIKEAIENDYLVPYFQGIFNNKTKEIDKYEALVRIEKDNEVISPYVFLEAAKLSGHLSKITEIMIDKTFKIMKENNFNFSINITEDDLNLNYLVNYIKAKIQEYDIKTSRITLEILEGISSLGKDNHITQLASLKSMGLKLAIDDFGKEYSNFERIIDLDIDLIKIDAKYIKDIHTNKKSYEITKALAFFAKNSSIKSVAEFVHNEEVQNIISELGIDYSQGYYFSEPSKIMK
jgi:PAS domain S-box-containing protein/diguanylate cyclase (GGDEF)-like protein